MKKIKVILIIVILILLTGCSDYRELSDMAIASSIGIDIKDGMYEITTQVLNTSMKSSENTSSSSPEIIVYHSNGKTIHEALRNLVLESPKKLYAGHLETVVVSNKIAKEDISEIFDLFLRDAEVSKDFKILVSKDAKVSDIMSLITPYETIPAENISSSIEYSSKEQGHISDITFDKFVSNVLQTGVDAVIPAITIKENSTINEEINPEIRLVIVNKLGIFKNTKFLTYLTESASLGYNLIYGDIVSNVISFKCDKNTYSSVELLKKSSKLTYDINTNTVNIDVFIKSAISELNCNIDIKKESEIKKLEQKLTDSIKSIMNDLIDEAKEYNESDFLGIGKYIYQNNYIYYKNNKDNIKDMIKSMKRNIKIKTEIIQKGIIKEGDEKY